MYRHYLKYELDRDKTTFCLQYYWDKCKNFRADFEHKAYRACLRRSKRLGIKYIFIIDLPEGCGVCFNCIPWYLAYIQSEYSIEYYIYKHLQCNTYIVCFMFWGFFSGKMSYLMPTAYKTIHHCFLNSYGETCKYGIDMYSCSRNSSTIYRYVLIYANCILNNITNRYYCFRAWREAVTKFLKTHKRYKEYKLKDRRLVAKNETLKTSGGV
jgi:hypothetical protein